MSRHWAVMIVMPHTERFTKQEKNQEKTIFVLV